MNVLLSVEPRFAEAIFSGNKRWEFRGKGFRAAPKKAYLYCTRPVQKVVGFFKVGRILFDSREEIWRICGEEGGISRDEFFKRFKNELICAIEILKPIRFDPPLELNSLRVIRPPRSFIYLGDTGQEGGLT